jgi:hypothetical protein
MPIDHTQLNQSIFLLSDPGRWSCRYSSRPTVATAIFAEFDHGGKVRLLDILGGIDPDWSEETALEITRQDQDVLTLDRSVWDQTQTLLQDCGPAFALSALANFMADSYPEWEDFSETLQADRFSASAWFERDRQNLVLTDHLANKDIVTLWDEAVTEAIEDGYLSRPKTVRPKDSDWIEPLKNYAQSMGLLPSEHLSFQTAAQARPNSGENLG